MPQAGVHDHRQPALVGHGEDPADRRVAQPEPLRARVKLDPRRAASEGALDLHARRRRAGSTRQNGTSRPSAACRRRRASGRWRRDSRRVRRAGRRPRDRRRPRALEAAHRPRSTIRPGRHSRGACGSRRCVSGRAGPAGRRTTARAARRRPLQPPAAGRPAAPTARCQALGSRERLARGRGCSSRAGCRTSVLSTRLGLREGPGRGAAGADEHVEGDALPGRGRDGSRDRSGPFDLAGRRRRGRRPRRAAV